MDQVPIPEEVRRFVLISIPSVPYLEALLLLRSSGDQVWQGEMLAKRLYIGDNAAISLLEQLHSAGILELADAGALAYHYRPKSDDLRGIVDGVAEAHAKNLIGVTNLIHAKTEKKAQRIADAFLWKKDT